MHRKKKVGQRKCESLVIPMYGTLPRLLPN